MHVEDVTPPDQLRLPLCFGFENQYKEITESIQTFRSGKRENVAIIGLPYSGKSTLLAALHTRYGDDSYLIEYGARISSKREFLESRYVTPIIFMDNCQHLFSRRIGGFSVLDDFLKEVSSSSSLFITTWNMYAWNYIRRIREVERFFPKIITIPALSDTEMRSCILSEYTEAELQFIGGVEVELPSLIRYEEKKATIPFKKEQLQYSVPRLNLAGLSLRRSRKEEMLSDEELVFKKITKMAEGNPGIGKAIWKKSFEYPTINLRDYRPIRIPDPLLRKDAFILGVIAMMGYTTEEELEDLAANEYDFRSTLYRLISLDIIMEKNGGYQVCPESVLIVHDILRKLRIFWE